MRVFITGASGLIGRHLVRRLVARGDDPVLLSRRAETMRSDPEFSRLRVVQGDPTLPGDWQTTVDRCDAVVNLAGHGIFNERWNAYVKRKIRNSRVNATNNVYNALRAAQNRPSALIQASAVGYYGACGDEELTEVSPPGRDFMANVCRDWEDAALPATQLGVRVVRVRIGIALAREGGALKTLLPVFKWVPGGAAPVGNGGRGLTPATGAQWVSWVHIDDVAELFLFALDRAEVEGPLNATAPAPVRYAEFGKTLAELVRRPYLPFGPPDALLRLVLGEVAQVLASGQRVMPSRPLALGYTFRRPVLADALRDLLAAPVSSERAG
jgi:uncharacterized protein (TIGR01777 family)